MATPKKTAAKTTKKVSTNTDAIDLKAVAKAQNKKASSTAPASGAPKFGTPAWRAKYGKK